MTGFNSKRDAVANKQHWNEDEWRRNNWRCGHGWLRGEQCESCNAAQEPPSEWASIKAILDEYGLQAIDFVADFKEALAQPAQEPVAYVTGMSFGRFIVEPLNRAMVLPVGMALYSAPQENK